MRYSKLAFKITVFLMFLIISSVLIYSFVFISAERNRLKRDIVEAGKTFGEFSTNSIYENYIQYYRHDTDEDFQQYKSIVEAELQKNEDVVRVMLIATNGRILFDSEEFTTGRYTSDEVRFVEDLDVKESLESAETIILEGIYQGREAVDVVVPIDESGIGHIASVKYTVSYDSLNQRFTAVIKDAIFTIVPVLAVCLVINIFFSYRIASPIIKLTELTKKISKGELDVQSNITSSDEIGELAASFDQMAQELSNSRKKLENYTRDLEKKVEERTKELKKNLEEIKSINKVMVDRELRMVELKENLSKCREKLKSKT